VALFDFFLEDRLFEIREALIQKTYTHGPYTSFYVTDPKLRFINKAEVVDRVVHQAVFRILYHIFDRGFISQSFSCRFKKGSHKGVEVLEKYIRKVTSNYTVPAYALKCDIKKFFASVNKDILLQIIQRKINDPDTLWLLQTIIDSFQSKSTTGIPLGNVTSQLFANIYLNELDQYIKRTLKLRYYLRYCDDFIILHTDKDYLLSLVTTINEFLQLILNVELHPNKITVTKINQGIDFLGYVVLPHYRIVRRNTKNRILRKYEKRTKEYQKGKIDKQSLYQSLQSYLGILKHAKAQGIQNKLLDKDL